MRVTLDIDEKYARALTATCVGQSYTGDVYMTGFAADLAEGTHVTIDKDGKAHLELDEPPTFKWISTIDELPQMFRRVLVFVPGDEPWAPVCEGYFRPDGSWHAAGMERAPDEITHWAPLPEPPEVTTA